jgi:hypothetical protein
MKVIVTQETYKDLIGRWIPISERELYWNELVINVWISRIEGSHALGIVSDERPTVLFDIVPDLEKKQREVKEDELEPESRKDTLWGDLKLGTKIVSRVLSHEFKEIQKRENATIRAPINIDLQLTNDDFKIVSIGNKYQFRITKIYRYSVTTLNVSGRLNQTNEIGFKNLDSFLKQRRIKNLILLLSPLFVFFVYGWLK